MGGPTVFVTRSAMGRPGGRPYEYHRSFGPERHHHATLPGPRGPGKNGLGPPGTEWTNGLPLRILMVEAT